MMYKKDQLILMTQGEYSDYHPTGLFRAKADFDPQDFVVVKEAKSGSPVRTWKYKDFDASIACMVRADVIEEVEYVELNDYDLKIPR